jgi:hypothetical protein
VAFFLAVFFFEGRRLVVLVPVSSAAMRTPFRGKHCRGSTSRLVLGARLHVPYCHVMPRVKLKTPKLCLT